MILPRPGTCTLLLPLLLGALAPALRAQYLNRAVWLGRDVEGLFRDYPQGDEYFLDRAAYTEVPPWRWPEALDPFGDRLFVAGGSVSTSRLTVEGVGNFHVPLDDTSTARLHYLQSEHQTTQFQRVGVGLDAALDADTAVFFQLEGGPDKSRSDLTLGVDLEQLPGRHRLAWTLVDFASNKSHTFRYEQAPYGLLAAGWFGSPGAFELGYELGLQLPFVETSVQTQERWRMQRQLGSLRARLPLGDRDQIVGSFGNELTQKAQRTPAGGGSVHEMVDTGLWQVRLEFVRAFAPDAHVAAGLAWLQLDNDGERSDGLPSVDERRREWTALLRADVPLGAKVALEPYLQAAYVARDLALPGAAAESFHGFQGTWGLPVLYRFSAAASLRFDVAMQLDEAAFAGGGVQFVATF